MDTMFKNPKLQKQLEEDGFVIVPMLSPQEIVKLQAEFDSIRPPEVRGIYSNVQNNSTEDNIRVDRMLSDIFQKYIDDLFVNCYLAGATFLVKGNNLESASTVHQDWNNVDERKHLSLSVWCPLIDVDIVNGALQVVKGSHRWFDTVRSTTLASCYLDFDDELEPFLTTVDMKAGEACIYAHNLWHGSKPNTTNIVRVSAVTGILPNNATHIHYYNDPNQTDNIVEMFQIDRDFYYKDLRSFHSGKRPDFKVVGKREYSPQPLERTFVMNQFRENYGKPIQKPGLWNRLRHLLRAN